MTTSVDLEWTEYLLRELEASETKVWPADLTTWEREGLRPIKETHYYVSVNDLDGTPSFTVGVGAAPDGAKLPEPGDRVWLKSNGYLGGRNAGFRFNDVVWFESDPDEMKADHEVWKATHLRQQHQDFARNRPKLDATYDALLPEFRARIDRFRGKDPDFRATDEGYEMAPLSAATALVAWVERPEFEALLRDADARLPKVEYEGVRDYNWTPEMGSSTWVASPANLIRAFDAINSALCGYRFKDIDEVDAKMKALTGLSVDPGAHSGNTWGAAIFMAVRYVNGERSF